MAAIRMLSDHDSPVRTLRAGEEVDDIPDLEKDYLVDAGVAEWVEPRSRRTTTTKPAKRSARKKDS